MMHQPPPLWSHQRHALERMEGRRAFALLMRQRTGKTRVALEDFACLQAAGAVDDLLVVAPAGVYRTWEGALQEHLAEPLRSQLRTHVLEASRLNGVKSYVEATRAFLRDRSRPRCLLANVEALSLEGKSRLTVQHYLEKGRVYFVIDESTIVKALDSKRTKYILSIAPLARYRRILTGLMTPEGPLDAYAQFEFLQPGLLGFENYYAFKARYVVTKKIWVPGLKGVPTWHPKAQAHAVDQVVGFKHLDDLGKRIAPHAVRVRLEDIYDMPPKVYQVRHVALTPEQRRIYGELRAYATARLEGERHVTATMAMVEMLRLHQVICGHVRDEQGQTYEVATNRPAELLAVLREHEGKAIVWCTYDHDVRAIETALTETYGPGCCARFWGGNRDTREAEEARFQTDPACRFMIGTPAAGGRGRMWAAADLVVYFSNGFSLEARDQSEERTQAVGKTVPTLYVDLVAPGTVDEKVLHILRKKLNVDVELSGVGWRHWVV